MKLFEASIIIVLVIMSLASLLNSPEPIDPLDEKVPTPKEERIKKDNSQDIDSDPIIETSTVDNVIKDVSTEKESNNFYKFFSILLIIVLIFILNSLRRKKKQLNEINNELSSYKDKLLQLKSSIDTKSPNKLLLQQVVFTLRSLNAYLEKVDHSDSEFFELAIFELKSILSNSGCKIIDPEVGKSILKDAELAQKVSIVNKKKSEHYKDQIGIILEVVNLGYETKEGELILTAEVIVTSK